ncbi:ImmA/IrrE family metallo-endopeptidase [Aestuariimicrobium sp. Y1814]|uniref:ImmA/IrrE family metallo-endopeptidase n=1 Tax=Aestuariimicrobium sp. Y1814 TaxID=3418742 RepID=UPI003DA73CAD
MPKVRISALRFSSLLANRNMNISDVAGRTKLGMLAGELSSGDQDIEFDDLLVLAKLFKRPWSYLLIDEAEAKPEAGTDNRTFANRKSGVSPELLSELQAADLMLESAGELFPDATFTVPGVVGDVPASRLAVEIRALLGVSIEEQLKIKDKYAALRRWVAALHGQGVYVSQRKLKDPTIRAFSKIVGNQAIIVVDTGDTPYARIFSALHEYCHITLHSTGICDLDDHSTTERYCNQVAAEVLLPSALLDQAVATGVFAGSDEAADEALKDLSKRLHVSQAALLIRLRDHHTISQQVYEAMELRRAARRGGDGGRKGGTHYPVAINKAGRLFAHRVVDAMTDGVIDRQDASVLLEIGEHTVPRFVTELIKGD